MCGRMNKTTFRELIQNALSLVKETFEDINFQTYEDADLDAAHENKYGGSNFKPFYAWSAKRVYFLCDYNGMNFVASVPRYYASNFSKPDHAFGGHIGKPVESGETVTSIGKVQVNANS